MRCSFRTFDFSHKTCRELFTGLQLTENQMMYRFVQNRPAIHGAERWLVFYFQITPVSYYWNEHENATALHENHQI